MATITFTCLVCGVTKEGKWQYVGQIPVRPKYCSQTCFRESRVHASTKYIGKRHVDIASRALGHPLPNGAVVHHVDRNSRNNTHSNLVICENDAYHYLLHARQRVVDAGGDPRIQKLCGRCKQLLPFTSFQICRSNGDGLQAKCKPCAIELTRQWRLKHALDP